jgi:hypothetical protein
MCFFNFLGMGFRPMPAESSVSIIPSKNDPNFTVLTSSLDNYRKGKTTKATTILVDKFQC